MKKSVVAFLAFFLGLSLVSCGTKKVDAVDKTKSFTSNNNQNVRVAENEQYIFFTNGKTVRAISKSDNFVLPEISFFLPEREKYDINSLEVSAESLCVTNVNNELSYTPDVINNNKFERHSPSVTAITINGNYKGTGGTPFEFTPYTYGDDIYYVFDKSQAVFKVTPNTLIRVDDDIKNKYITADETIFTIKTENNISKLYSQAKDGEMILFSAEDEAIIPDRINYTDYYVYYVAYSPDNLKLYRADLNRENKVLIKEFVKTPVFSILYDNKYIYLAISEDEYLKIDKETFEQTNIADIPGIFNPLLEVSNEKFFYLYEESYYIDTVTGEKVIIE